MELGRFGEWIKSLPWIIFPRAVQMRSVFLHKIKIAGEQPTAVLFLAKQAGFDLEFQFCDQPLKDSRLYILPSLSGGGSFSRHFWLNLLERVSAGATLYVRTRTACSYRFSNRLACR